MRNSLFCLLLALIPILFLNSVIAGRCSGGAYCTACSNCSSCKNCSEEGGTCSVCANYNEPEPQEDVVPVPVAETESDDSYNSDYSDDYSSDYDEPKEEKSSYGWVWWVVGGVVFLGIIGSPKK